TDNVWVANSNNGGSNGSCVARFTSAGAPVTPVNGIQGGGIFKPMDVAVDLNGNVWVADRPGINRSLTEIEPTTKSLNPARPFQGGGLKNVVSIQIDANDDIWVGNDAVSRVSKFTQGPPVTALSPTTGFQAGAANQAHVAGIAIDGAGNLWTANFKNNDNTPGISITELDTNGNPLTGDNGLSQQSLDPFGLAIDQSGNVWVTDGAHIFVTEYLGAARPVRTPTIGPPVLP